MLVPAGVDNYCPGTCQGSCSCSSKGCGDSYGYSPRQCTGFCAYRINNTLGISFGAGRTYGGNWHNANGWAAGARAQGLAVNGTAAANAIVCLPNNSRDGHVAFVLEVGPSAHASAGQIWVEDYNFGFTCSYRQHLLPIVASGTNQTLFIHFPGGSTTPPPPPPPITMAEAGSLGLVVLGLSVLYVSRNPKLRARVFGSLPSRTSGYDPVSRLSTFNIRHRTSGNANRGSGFVITQRAASRRRAAVAAGSGGYSRDRDDDAWQQAYNNAAERLFNKRAGDTLTEDEDAIVIAEANAEIRAQR